MDGGCQMMTIMEAMSHSRLAWMPLPCSKFRGSTLQTSSLFCYTCENEHSNWNCLKTYKCEDHEKYCTTTYSAAGYGKDTGYRITKKCSADCPETNTDFGVVAISTKCCGTSLCNFSGANSVKLSYAVMFLGTVASLICVIRAGL